MFAPNRARTRLNGFFEITGLIFEGTAREIRKNSRNPILAILSEVMRVLVFVAVFYVMFAVLGNRTAPLRGDFVIFLVSGIFLFFAHTRAVSAVLGAEGPTSAMMQHAPMNSIISIGSSALSVLYSQAMAAGIILLGYHVFTGNVLIDKPVGAVLMFVLAWFSGVAIGMMLMAAKPWFPALISIISKLYRRSNMIASGKMFAANTLPGWMVNVFDWNPLFHAIDQARVYTFLNYSSDVTNIVYPLVLSVVCIMIGFMMEFFTRQHASASWGVSKI